MESYEKKSDEAASEAEKLAEEGERVDKHIEETKSDWELMRAESESGESPDGADD